MVVPVYLLQPFVDECMKTGSDPATWKIPWMEVRFEGGVSWRRTEIVLLDQVSPNRLILVLAFIAFLSMFLRSVITYLGELASAAFSNRAVRSVRIDLFDKFVSLPLGFYHQRKAGELISRSTADLTVMVRISIPHRSVQYLLIIFLAYLCLTKADAPRPHHGSSDRRPHHIFGTGRHAAAQENTSYLTAAYQETLLCLKVVQGFGTKEHESRKFRSLANQLYKSIMRWNRWNLGLGPY
jgi:subfamily B ATP-binding cassette protein MsbA